MEHDGKMPDSADPFDRLMLADSYTRMSILLDLYADPRVDRMQWFRTLGSEWSGCDNVSRHKGDLRIIFDASTPAEREAMMARRR